MPHRPIPQLRQERERRGWSRNYVAEQIQVDVVTVGRWERGERVPHPIYRQKLCHLFDMNAQDLGLFIEPSQQQAEEDAPDGMQTRNEGAGACQSTRAPEEEPTEGKPHRNTGFASGLAHVLRRGLNWPHLVLVMILLAVGTVSGVLFLTSSAQRMSFFHVIYTNGTILPENCTYGNEGPIISPREVANGCPVRVWLYQNDHTTGRELCLSPGTTTGHLKPIWVYFRVSKNSSVCSSSNL